MQVLVFIFLYKNRDYYNNLPVVAFFKFPSLIPNVKKDIILQVFTVDSQDGALYSLLFPQIQKAKYELKFKI